MQRISWRRVVTGWVGVSGMALALIWLDRIRPPGAGGTVLALVLGMVLVPLLASPLEWMVHRFVYHQTVLAVLRPIHTVHTVHHVSYFPTWRYVTRGPARRLAITDRAPRAHESVLRNAGVRSAHFAWYMSIGALMIWAPAWSLTRDRAFMVGVFIASAVVSNLFIVVHDTIHRPGSHRFVEAQPWFEFLDRHHWVHHVDLGANLNFLLPLGDLLFGTLRTSTTAEELVHHGTLAEAKSRPVGLGETARAAAHV